jgi:hypothetical protein
MLKWILKKGTVRGFSWLRLGELPESCERLCSVNVEEYLELLSDCQILSMALLHGVRLLGRIIIILTNIVLVLVISRRFK